MNSMGRPPSGKAKKRLVAFRITDAQWERLDQERGTTPLAMYARSKVLGTGQPQIEVEAPPLERPLPEPTVKQEPVHVIEETRRGPTDHVHKPDHPVYGGPVGRRWVEWVCACGWHGTRRDA